MSAVDFFNLSFTCKMNQRYYQEAIAYWDRVDKTIAIAVAIAALFATMFTIWAYFMPQTACVKFKWLKWLTWDRLAVGFAIITLAVAMVLNIIPTTTKVSFNSQMMQRWSDLRRDVDSAWNDLSSHKSDEAATAFISERYRDLLAQKNNLNALEPAPDKTLLDESYRETVRAVEGEPPPPEPKKSDTVSLAAPQGEPHSKK